MTCVFNVSWTATAATDLLAKRMIDHFRSKGATGFGSQTNDGAHLVCVARYCFCPIDNVLKNRLVSGNNETNVSIASQPRVTTNGEHGVESRSLSPTQINQVPFSQISHYD